MFTLWDFSSVLIVQLLVKKAITDLRNNCWYFLFVINFFTIIPLFIKLLRWQLCRSLGSYTQDDTVFENFEKFRSCVSSTFYYQLTHLKLYSIFFQILARKKRKTVFQEFHRTENSYTIHVRGNRITKINGPPQYYENTKKHYFSPFLTPPSKVLWRWSKFHFLIKMSYACI